MAAEADMRTMEQTIPMRLSWLPPDLAQTYSMVYPSRPEAPMVSGEFHLMVRLESVTSSTDTSRGALVGTEGGEGEYLDCLLQQRGLLLPRVRELPPPLQQLPQVQPPQVQPPQVQPPQVQPPQVQPPQESVEVVPKLRDPVQHPQKSLVACRVLLLLLVGFHCFTVQVTAALHPRRQVSWSASDDSVRLRWRRKWARRWARYVFPVPLGPDRTKRLCFSSKLM
ncbi:hypothetical protein EYF80_005612 [Liparis tanakae]|uniref:Uncharacterized protein n=1 Tax=Liparis tanakae TaxID=230148 RepID=A0A4Z2J1R6_9TELE|nr:hypothetical protein EYF80_005612 [Liparis tanakae]